MTLFSKISRAALLAFALASGAGAREASTKADAVAVVCAPGCSYPALSAEDVESAWSGRRPPEAIKGAELWDLPDGNPIQARFVQAALSKDSTQYRAMWAKNVFNGRGRPPRAAADEDAMAKELTANPKSLGYMSAARAEKFGLKILATF